MFIYILNLIKKLLKRTVFSVLYEINTNHNGLQYIIRNDFFITETSPRGIEINA